MISIAIPSYQRAPQLRKTLDSIVRQKLDEEIEVVLVEDGDDGGATRAVCAEFSGLVRYLQRKDRAPIPYSPPAIPWNIAIRHTRGDVLILQNPECLHVDADVIARLVDPVRENEKVVTFATVTALDPNGNPWQSYVHPIVNARPFFFCGAIGREFIFSLGGYDEDFRSGYGYDDTSLSLRMGLAGAQFIFTRAEVHHQWHASTNCWGLEANAALYNEKARDLMAGRTGVEANVGREWGVLTSDTVASK
jgi:GT2 family glycosyltransferase